MLVSIIKKNIKEQFLDNKGLFIIFLICQLISFIAFTYIHCHYQTLDKGLDVPDFKFSELKMDVSQEDDFVYSDFIKEVDNYKKKSSSKIEYIALLFDVVYHDSDDEDTTIRKMCYNDTFPFMAYAYGEQEKLDYYKNNVKYFSGDFFSDAELNGNILSGIIADEYQAEESERITKLTIDNKEIDIIGQVSTLDNRDCILPFKAAEKYNIRPSQVIFKFDTTNCEGKDVFYSYINNKKEMEKYFPQLIPHAELKYYKTEIPKTVEMYICIGILLLSIINFSYLYIYFLKRNKKNTDIYQICGCSQKKIAQMLAAEIFLLNIIGYSICILLCKYVLIPIIFSCEPLIYFNMNMEFIIINFVLINLLCYFVCYPFIKKYSVLENINKEF